MVLLTGWYELPLRLLPRVRFDVAELGLAMFGALLAFLGLRVLRLSPRQALVALISLPTLFALSLASVGIAAQAEALWLDPGLGARELDCGMRFELPTEPLAAQLALHRSFAASLDLVAPILLLDGEGRPRSVWVIPRDRATFLRDGFCEYDVALERGRPRAAAEASLPGVSS